MTNYALDTNDIEAVLMAYGSDANGMGQSMPEINFYLAMFSILGIILLLAFTAGCGYGLSRIAKRFFRSIFDYTGE